MNMQTEEDANWLALVRESREDEEESDDDE